MKKMLLIIPLFIIIALFAWFLFGSAPKANISWGVNFSQMHAENLGLDWKEFYLAVLDDLKVKNIKILVNWDWISGKKGEFYFNDLDFQIQEAKKRDVKVILSVGMKTGRWPECHIPDWAKLLSKEEREQAVLAYLDNIVNRYKNSVSFWQVENEPFFPFGNCPKTDVNFLREEVALVKQIDPAHPVIITDTGEFSLWLKPSKIGDIVGTTMYSKVWLKELNSYFLSPFPPLSYYLRAKLINWVYGKKVQCLELQAEPWGPVLLYDLPLLEQEKSMDIYQFKKNIEFAKKTGWDTFYLWGVEWWYQMKSQKPEFWEEAKKLFI